MVTSHEVYDRGVRELPSGLWHWQAPHPDWTPDEPWDEMVSSYAIDDGERLLLFDPLAVPDELMSRAAERKPMVVLTAPWHERDTRIVVERLGAPVFTPPPDTQRDLMEINAWLRGGVTRDQVVERLRPLLSRPVTLVLPRHADGQGSARARPRLIRRSGTHGRIPHDA